MKIELKILFVLVALGIVCLGIPQLLKAYTEYKVVQKWNGVLPQYMVGSSPSFVKFLESRK